jgi:D-alanyl-D-alanine-carboxypeptidase/D-alanyl-D-alanine-endopeptidase
LASRRTSVALHLVAILASMSKNSPFVPPPIPADDLIRRILVDRVDERRLSVGMVVGITEAKSHFVVSHGCRDASSGDSVNEKTTFEIGSITKLFTALLLADMANRGEVGLDEPVAELLPAGTRVPVRHGRTITLHDLASHHSGLPRLPTNLGYGPLTRMPGTQPKNFTSFSQPTN